MALALVVVVAAPAALACGDSGAHNSNCSDGGWRFCSSHSDCAEGQHCDYQGQCACNPRNPSVLRDRCPAETCDDAGCRCCAPVPAVINDASGCPGPRYWCPVSADGGAGTDGGNSTDGSVSAIDGEKGCAVAPVGTGSTSVAPAAFVTLAMLAVLAGRRRE